jgi:hypothetical protein
MSVRLNLAPWSGTIHAREVTMGIPSRALQSWLASAVLLAGCGRFGYKDLELHVEVDAGAADAPSGDATTFSDLSDGGPGVTILITANVIFLTSTFHTGNLGGVAGADAICNDRARDAGLDGQFIAYLSTTTTPARDRFASARGWVRPDGLPVANLADDLAHTHLLYPPRLDEFGDDLGGDTLIWTGSDTTSGWHSSWGTCEEWTSDAGDAAQGWGQQAEGFSTHGGANCASLRRLACLGTDRFESVVAAPTPGARLAFVSSQSLIPGGGLAAADAICQQDADDAGFDGSFRALLATSTASALSRFNTTGAPWARPDGAMIVTRAEDLAGAELLTAITRRAEGAPVLGFNAWATADIDVPATSTCGDWTTTSGTGSTGSIGDTLAARAFGVSQNVACSFSAAYLYCLQE